MALDILIEIFIIAVLVGLMIMFGYIIFITSEGGGDWYDRYSRRKRQRKERIRKLEKLSKPSDLIKIGIVCLFILAIISFGCLFISHWFYVGTAKSACLPEEFECEEKTFDYSFNPFNSTIKMSCGCLIDGKIGTNEVIVSFKEKVKPVEEEKKYMLVGSLGPNNDVIDAQEILVDDHGEYILDCHAEERNADGIQCRKDYYI